MTSSAPVPVCALSLDLFTTMEPLEDDWRRLETDDYCSLHQGYDWCRAWVKTHANPLAIVRGQWNGRTVLILPLEITTAVMVRRASFIAARFSNINTGLFTPELRQQMRRASIKPFAQQLVSLLKPHADVLSLSNIPLHWRGEHHPLASLPCVEHQNHAFQLPLFADFSATIAQLNAKRRRKKFRNQQRKLENYGGYQHVIAERDEQKTHLLDLFFKQKAVRFKTLGLPDVFQTPGTKAFFHQILQSAHDRMNMPLELHALQLGHQANGPIAAIAGLSRKGSHVLCQFGSIDETLAPEASPGELLFWLMIEQCCAQGATLFDFGLGDQGYKRGWCPVETIQHDIVLPLTPLGHGAATAQRLLTRTKAAIKHQQHLYAFLQKIRARMNHGAE